MWFILGKPVRRWVAMSVLMPLTAASLSMVGRYLQRRNGYPTRTSRVVLWSSRKLGSKQKESQQAELATANA